MLLKKTLFSAFMAAGILLSVSALEVQADPLETGTKAMQETQESAQAANAGDLMESGRKNYAVASVSEGSYVNVRENAGTEYPVVGKLENHGLCYIQEQSGEWYRVVSGEVEGYIRGDLLKTGRGSLDGGTCQRRGKYAGSFGFEYKRGTGGIRLSVCGKSLCMGRHQPDQRRGLLRIYPAGICQLRNQPSPFLQSPGRLWNRSGCSGSPAGRPDLLRR